MPNEYAKADLGSIVREQCHLNQEQCNKLYATLLRHKQSFSGMVGSWCAKESNDGTTTTLIQ